MKLKSKEAVECESKFFMTQVQAVKELKSVFCGRVE